MNSIKKSFDDLLVQNSINQCKELNVETISQLITEQILKLDSTLCELLKSSGDIAGNLTAVDFELIFIIYFCTLYILKLLIFISGTTCLIALRIISTNELIVVNIGDSRGILCDNKGIFY